jgi:hypothetical protein
MAKKDINPELKPNDRVVLLKMPVDSVTLEPNMITGLKGTVINKVNSPFEPYYEYEVKWDNGSTLRLLPDIDMWMLDKSSKITESLDVNDFKKTQNFFKYVKEKKVVFEFLKALQKSGLINMLGAKPFLGYTSENLTDYIKGQFKDVDEYEDLIGLADDSRNALIRGVLSMYENNNLDTEDLSKVNRDFQKLLGEVMHLYLTNHSSFIK